MQIKLGRETSYEKYRDKNSHDAYSVGVVSYSEAWANLMEAQLAQGHTIEACAKKTSYQAGTEGITGFMYGCAVSALAEFWEHGEALRRWAQSRCSNKRRR